MLTAGTRVGPYEILGPLGAGGMGVVYRARDTRLDRDVAIKMITPDLARDGDAVLRFEREARAVAALSHPNILALHDIGSNDGTPYAVTELLEGESLRGRLTRGALPWRDAARVARAMADGLAFAEARGIVHRDLKPENVFLTSDGRVKILDFGLALTTQAGGQAREAMTVNLTMPGMIVGTIGYAAPEQLRGEAITSRADLFSLGCVLYEMLAGRRAFEAATSADTMAAILQQPPAPLIGSSSVIPIELERVVTRCLEKDAAARFATAQDLSDALERILQERDVPAPRKPRASRSGRNRSLAVLPFTSDDRGEDLHYMTDGITEALINRLASIPRLRVAPRSSVFRLKGHDLDARAAGERLDVKTIVTGRLARHGERLLVQAELIDVSENAQLWGQHYKREIADLVSVVETIAGEIAEALKLKLTGSEQRRLTSPPTDKTAAYQEYLRGRYFFNKYTPDGFERAIACFEQALKIDADYALAYAGLGDAYGSAAFLGYTVPVQGVSQAETAAAKALALDPALSEAHLAAAKLAFFFRRDWVAAERGFLRAVELRTADAESRICYALYLLIMGRRDEALSHAQRALDDDPLSGIVNALMVLIYLLTGNIQAGLARGRQAVQLDPTLAITHQMLAFAHELAGNFEEAIESGGPVMIGFGVAHAAALDKLRVAYREGGARGYWDQRLRGLRDMAARGYVPPFMFAYAYIQLGDRESSLEYLERALEVSSGMLVFVGLNPAFRPLHGEPRFTALLQQLGVAAG